MRSILMLLVAAVLVGCPSDHDDSAPAGPPPSEADLEITGDADGDPAALDFGLVTVGVVEVAELILTNDGGSDLLLAPPTFSGAPGFDLATPEGWPSLLEPGDEASVFLRWAPVVDGEATGHMLFETSAPAALAVDLVLRGDGLGPRLEVAPEEIDFGEVPLYCDPAEETLLLGNTGRAPLMLSGVDLEVFADPAEIALEDGPVEAVLEPGDVIALTLSFAPTVVGQQHGLVTLSTDDPTWPELQVTARGSGELPPLQVDTFQAGVGMPVDILWVIDNSSSVSDVQSMLASSLAQWFDDQLGSGLLEDWHLGVTTTDLGDDGQLQGSVPVITSTTIDADWLFSSAANLGTSGSGIEQPFHSAYRALHPDNALSGPNQGFLRPSATLALIFVCDEAEQSSSIMGWNAQDYLASWQALKMNPDHVVVSAISGGVSGCTSANSGASSGIDFVTVAGLTGGISASICDWTWPTQFNWNSWHPATPADHFPLAAVPVAASLEVELGDVPLPAEHWSFDAALNNLVLEEAASPDPGEELRISYVPVSACSP